MTEQNEAKKYLERYRNACDELESLAEEHERIISTIYSMTSDPSKEGGSPGGASDKVGDGVASLIDHCRKTDDEIKYYIAVRDDVKSIVREVMHENIHRGQSLHYRYIMGWNPVVTANQMGYSERQERDIHRKALERAWKIIERRGAAQSPPQTAAFPVV